MAEALTHDNNVIYNPLSFPPISNPEHQILFYVGAKLYLISDGDMYNYNVEKDKWVHKAHGEFAINTNRVDFYKRLGGYATFYQHYIFLFGIGTNGGGLYLQKIDYNNGDYNEPYPICNERGVPLWSNYKIETISALGANNEFVQFNLKNIKNVHCIRLDDIKEDRSKHKYLLNLDNITYINSSLYDMQYIFVDNVFGPGFSFIVTDGYLEGHVEGTGSYTQNGLYVVEVEDDHLVSYNKLITAVKDSLGCIFILGNDNRQDRAVLRVYIIKENDTETHHKLVSKVIGFTDTKIEKNCASIIFDNNYYILGKDYFARLDITLVDNFIIALNHLGKTVKINTYNNGELPILHNNKLRYLKVVEEGDSNASPLVFKHNGKLYWISN